MPNIGHYASHTSVFVLVFTRARSLLFSSSILATNKSLRNFNITKPAAKRSQRAMLHGQYWVYKIGPKSMGVRIIQWSNLAFYYRTYLE